MDLGGKEGKGIILGPTAELKIIIVVGTWNPTVHVSHEGVSILKFIFRSLYNTSSGKNCATKEQQPSRYDARYLPHNSLFGVYITAES